MMYVLYCLIITLSVLFCSSYIRKAVLLIYHLCLANRSYRLNCESGTDVDEANDACRFEEERRGRGVLASSSESPARRLLC